MALKITCTHRFETWEANIKLNRFQAPNKLSDVPEGLRFLRKANQFLKALVQRSTLRAYRTNRYQ